jgi:prevent-host-death family protein
MVVKIGVRELKNRASEIVREVRESKASYVVTVRGEPVAELRPLGVKTIRERREEEADEIMREVEDLSRRISRAWKSSKTAVELVEEQRR